MILILGLDGLEYDFVEAWNLTNLMQSQYGKIEVPISEKTKVPMSPQVWSSFLTGKIQDIQFTPDPNRYEFLLSVFGFLRSKIPISLGIGHWIKKTSLKETGVRGFNREELSDNTFLDVTNSKAINVPFVNFDNVTFNISHRFAIDEITLDDAIDLLKKNYESHKDLFLKEVLYHLDDVEVVFAYMQNIDQLQHKAFLRRPVIEWIYEDVNAYIATLKDMFLKKNPDSYFIIVSDHGFSFLTNNHSLYGFYSCNQKLDQEPKKITDFYNIILDLINT